MAKKTAAQAAEENFEKPFHLPEIFLMVFIVGGADAFDVISNLAAGIPIVGQILIFINSLLDIAVFAFTQFWFIMKGASRHSFIIKRSLVFAVGSLAEFIPFLDIFPFRTAGLLIAVYLANHPSLEEKIKLLEKL